MSTQSCLHKHTNKLANLPDDDSPVGMVTHQPTQQS